MFRLSQKKRGDRASRSSLVLSITPAVRLLEHGKGRVLCLPQQRHRTDGRTHALTTYAPTHHCTSTTAMYTITIKPENANSIQRLRNDRNEIMYKEGELKESLKRLDNELSKQKTRIEEMKKSKESTTDITELNRRIRGEENFLDAMEATKKELKEDLKALTQEQNKKAKRKQFKDLNEKPKKVLKESNITPMKKAAMEAVRELKKFKEEVFEDGEWYLSRKKVEHYLTIQWKLLKPNEALKGLCDMLEMCPYQQDFLKSKILEKIGKMDLNAADEDAVEGSLVPELETIWLMADTTLPRTWREMMTLKTKIKKIDRFRKSFDL